MDLHRRHLLRAIAGAGLALGIGRPALATATDKPVRQPIRRPIQKPIPGTKETLPVIGIGTNRYRTGDNLATLSETLRIFHELGGTLIDTAPVYRSSEQALGTLMQDLGIRDDLFVATKIGLEDRERGLQRMRNSLEKLQTKRLDLVQSHNMRGAETMLPAMREWQQDGRIRYIGITTSSNDAFPRMLALMQREPLEFIQVNYSLGNRLAAERILPLAIDKGIAVLVNLPFGRGRLFSTLGDRPLPAWAAEFDCRSWAQFLLKYVVSHPAVTCAIPGTTKPHHARDNFGAAFGRLPDAALRRKQEAFFDAL